jgi:hypothetical protein
MFQAEEENANFFYDCHIHDLSLWGTFILALWFDFVFCTKFYELMQKLYWFLQSFKWKPLSRPCQNLKVEL